MDDTGPQQPRADGPPPHPPRDAPPPVAPPPEKREKEGPLAFLRELPLLIVIAFGLALIIKTFLVQAFFIPSESMVPTLEVGDRVLVNKLVYRIRDPRRGEIVVFVGERDKETKSFLRRVRDFLFEGFGGAVPAHKDYIKRVIGLPGETIRIKNGAVTITTVRGEKLQMQEPYLAAEEDDSSFGPETVPAGSYFVMGDNRANSSDSRSDLGPIPKGDIVGRAFVRIWPLSRFDFFRRPAYEQAARAAVLLIPAGALTAGFVRRRRAA